MDLSSRPLDVACETCGGVLEFNNAVGNRTGTANYCCDQCGRVVTRAIGRDGQSPIRGA
jgi:uncharacterized Zn finger protein